MTEFGTVTRFGGPVGPEAILAPPLVVARSNDAAVVEVWYWLLASVRRPWRESASEKSAARALAVVLANVLGMSADHWIRLAREAAEEKR